MIRFPDNQFKWIIVFRLLDAGVSFWFWNRDAILLGVYEPKTRIQSKRYETLIELDRDTPKCILE